MTLFHVIAKLKNIENKGIIFINSDEDKIYSYREIYENSLHILYVLQNKGLKPGDKLILQLKNNIDIVCTYWACILGKIVPVPLTLGNNTSNFQKFCNVCKLLNNPYVLISKKDHRDNHLFFAKERLKDIYSAIYLEDILGNGGEGNIIPAKPSDVAYIQFSSGSTGNPKGVVLTHQNLMVNTSDILNKLVGTDNKEDVFHSWMPLTHDLGLIIFHLVPLLKQLNHVIIPSELFVRNPSIWLSKISLYNSTITASTNFGLAYCLKNFNFKKYNSLNLSYLKTMIVGAEPLDYKLCRSFVDTFSNYGLKKGVFSPGYGLAEACVGVTLHLSKQDIKVHTLNKEFMNIGDKVKYEKRVQDGVSFLEVGSLIGDYKLRVTNDDNVVLPDEHIGNVEIKGKNVTSGYYNNPQANSELFSSDGWLKTGDIGFLIKNNLILTGRKKDIIIINGINYYPHDIERYIESIANVKPANVIVSSFYDEETKIPELLIFILNRKPLKDFIPLVIKCRKYISKYVGCEVNKVIPVNNIPKTTSGKLQRYKLLNDYFEGKYKKEISEIENLIDVSKKASNESINKSTDVSYIQKKLQMFVSEITKLKTDRIDLDASLLSFGVDSFLLSNFQNKIMNEFEIEIPLNDFFIKYDNLRKISEKIVKERNTVIQ